MNSRVVLVDRDGVLNQDYVGDYVKHWEDFKFLPGVLPALALLRQGGLKTIVISNQAGIGDGVYAKEQLDDITLRMKEAVRQAGGEVADVFYCLHGKEAGCACRKPRTGLFKQARESWHFEPAVTFFIGDKLSDIQAGRDFGLKTIMVMTGYGRVHVREITPASTPDFTCEDFKQAVDIVLNKAEETKP